MGPIATRVVIFLFILSLFVQGYKLYASTADEQNEITPQFEGEANQQGENTFGKVQDLNNGVQGQEGSQDIDKIDIRADKGVQQDSKFVSEDDVVQIHVKYCIG